LHPDSKTFERLATQKVVEKTDTQLWNVFENERKMSSPVFIIEEMKKLNPTIKIESDSDRWLLFSSVDIEKLVLPEWFYYNQKNWITNKHNTQSGIYGSVRVYPIEYYNPELV
jgi:hypothetical protein